MIRVALVAVLVFVFGSLTVLSQSGPARLPGVDAPQEAPASFQLLTNGATSQESFLSNLDQFSQDATETGGDDPGLGPTFNGTSCLQCHRNPAPGGGLSRFELRAGKLDPLTGAFVAPPGGTLVRQLAVDPAAQQRVPDGYFTTDRRSTSLFGIGFVEAIRDADILAYRDSQPADMRGFATTVLATTAISPDGTLTQVNKVGRFGWKCQQGTLLDFAADAQSNEKGVTSPILPNENPGVDGRSLNQFKKTGPEPEDEADDGAPFGKDVTAYTRLMRSLQAPPRDFTLSATPDAQAGQLLFGQIGCTVCHRPDWTTAAVGSTPAGLSPVNAAIGNRIFHPYSDWLLHDIGTGDTEVVQGGPDSTRKMLRTAPLWGVRTVPQLGHDGRWKTFEQAIQGHAGQAAGVRGKYNLLTPDQQRQVKAFLLSL